MNIKEFVEYFDFEVYRSEKDKCYYLRDTLGANLANIEEDKFENAWEIVDRLSNYINDYVVNDHAEKMEDVGIDTTSLSLEDIKEWYVNNKLEFSKVIDYIIDPDMLDMSEIELLEEERGIKNESEI